jgi:hypothetical protein
MEYGPQNALVNQSPIELPQTQVQEEDLIAEKNAAKFSKTKEYKVLKEYLESRINYYQTQLPDGRSITDAKPQDWIVANLVIAEFNAVLNAYEQARQAVEDSSRGRI